MIRRRGTTWTGGVSMRLGKVQATGFVADVTEEELTQEPQALAPAAPEPAVVESEQVSVTG